jgi:hypothetical protein
MFNNYNEVILLQGYYMLVWLLILGYMRLVEVRVSLFGHPY